MIPNLASGNVPTNSRVRDAFARLSKIGSARCDLHDDAARIGYYVLAVGELRVTELSLLQNEIENQLHRYWVNVTFLTPESWI